MTIALAIAAPQLIDQDGVLRIADSGVLLETAIWAYKDGAAPEDIARQYPTLELGGIYFVIGHYLRNRDRVEQYLDERARLYDDTNQRIKQDLPDAGLRQRLQRRTKP